MSLFPKFIVEEDDVLGKCLIVAKCTYHKDLAIDITMIRGGGWWTLDMENKVFTLSGESHDFGPAKLEDIKECIENKNVFSNSHFRRSLLPKFSFRYKNQLGEITIL